MRFNAEQKIEAVVRYQQGESLESLALAYGVDKKRIHGWSKTYKHDAIEAQLAFKEPEKKSRRYTRHPLSVKIEAVSDIFGGMSVEDVMEKYNVSRATVFNWKKSVKDTKVPSIVELDARRTLWMIEEANKGQAVLQSAMLDLIGEVQRLRKNRT